MPAFHGPWRKQRDSMVEGDIWTSLPMAGVCPDSGQACHGPSGAGRSRAGRERVAIGSNRLSAHAARRREAQAPAHRPGLWLWSCASPPRDAERGHRAPPAPKRAAGDTGLGLRQVRTSTGHAHGGYSHPEGLGKRLLASPPSPSTWGAPCC